MDILKDLADLTSVTDLTNVTVLLGDFARSADGKLDVIGAGWDTMHVEAPAPFGVGMIVELASTKPSTFVVELWLEDADGRPVDQTGAGAMRVRIDVETNPPSSLAGRPMSVPLAVNFPPLQGIVAGRYRFVVAVDGQTRPHWARSFNVV